MNNDRSPNFNNPNVNNFGQKISQRGIIHHPIFLITLLILIVFGGIVWAKNTNHLGSWKNTWLNSPFKTGEQETIPARMNQGLARLQQTNRNVADEELYHQGHTEFRKNEINNPVLLKNYFDNIPDMYSFGKVYSIFYFSNTDKDHPWIKAIQQARDNDNAKIMTFNGNLAQKNDGTFIYRYFYHNYDVAKTNPDYGKVDGAGHPFMALFVGGVPQNIIVDEKDFNNLIQKQNQIQARADKQANNYNLPDQHVGIPYPNYGNAINQAKAFISNHQSNNQVNSEVNASKQGNDAQQSNNSSSSAEIPSGNYQNDPKQ